MTDENHTAREARLAEIAARLYGATLSETNYLLTELASADKRAGEMAGLLRDAIEIIDYYASDSEDVDILGRLRTAADHAEPAKTQGERT